MMPMFCSRKAQKLMGTLCPGELRERRSKQRLIIEEKGGGKGGGNGGVCVKRRSAYR